MSLVVAWGLGFLLGIMVQCTCLPRHPGTKTSVSVSSISHICPGARALGESAVLENVQFIRNLPGHFLDASYCAGRPQRNHELLDLYKENIHYLFVRHV